MTPFSLRIRLLRILAIPLVAGLMAIGVGSYFSAKSEAEEMFDAQLVHFARILTLLAQHGTTTGNTPVHRFDIAYDDLNITYANDFAYRIWRGDRLLFQSEKAIAFGPSAQGAGFSDRIIGNKPWRFFVLRMGSTGGTITIEVAEDYHARQDLVHQMGLSILGPLFFIIPLLVAAVWYGVRYGIAPLNKLSDVLRRQTPEKLDPIDPAIAPTEVMPLVNAIDHLMVQVHEFIEREKRFTRYAAHELRTPLAALKTQVQVALREKNEDTRKELLQDVLGGVDRLTHLLEQLLIIARAQQNTISMQDISFSNLVISAIDAIQETTEPARYHLHAQVAPSIDIQGNPELLSIMLRNLLDNAVRYSPENAEITVSLIGTEGNRFEFTVGNSPVFLSEEQAARIFEPFYRPALTDHTQGSGLGLSIVGWAAKAHGFLLTHSIAHQCFRITISGTGKDAA